MCVCVCVCVGFCGGVRGLGWSHVELVSKVKTLLGMLRTFTGFREFPKPLNP